MRKIIFGCLSIITLAGSLQGADSQPNCISISIPPEVLISQQREGSNRHKKVEPPHLPEAYLSYRVTSIPLPKALPQWSDSDWKSLEVPEDFPKLNSNRWIDRLLFPRAWEIMSAGV